MRASAVFVGSCLALLLAGPLHAQPPAMSDAQGDTKIIPALIEVLKDSDPDTRQYAALALAAIGPRAVEPLIKALTDQSRERRAGSAYALGQIGPGARAAIPTLVQALQDEMPSVRRQAAFALSRIIGQNAEVPFTPPPIAPVPEFPPVDGGSK